MGMLRCNGAPVLKLALSLPRIGNWSADVEYDYQTTLAVGDSVTLEDNGLSWNGTVKRTGRNGARRHARVVGGKSKLGTELPPKSYVGTTARSIVADILSAAGETLERTSGGEPFNVVPTYWTRAGFSAGTELARICAMIGADWRMLPEGTVWVGVESYPLQKFAHEEIEASPESASYVIGSERLELRPGVTFDGRRVSRVEHIVTEKSARTVYWTE